MTAVVSAVHNHDLGVEDAIGLECRLDRARLTEALATVGVGVSSRPVVPLLGGVLLDGNEGTLSLSTTDYESFVSVRVPEVTVAIPGRLLVDHAELTKLIAALVTGVKKREADALPVTIRATVDGTGVVEIDGYSMPLTTYPVEQFPGSPERPDTVAEVDRERLTSEAGRVLVAAGTDEALPMLTGARLAVQPGVLTIAATDRFRLAVSEFPAMTPDAQERSVVVPAGVLSRVFKHCTAERLALGWDDAGVWVSLTCGGFTIQTRALDVSFPPYENLFPTIEATADVDRAALVEATRRSLAVLKAKSAGHQVTVTVDPGGAVSVAPVLDEHVEKVTAPQHRGTVRGVSEPAHLPFCASYVRDALSAVDGETVRLSWQGPTRPVLFGSSESPGYRHLLMPVRPARAS